MKKLYPILRQVVLSVVFLVASYDAVSQTRKGERLVNEGRYEEAIKPLQKAFVGKETDRKAGKLLIESHYMLQQYQDALDVAEMMNMESSDDEVEMVLFGDVLIANNDFSRAYLYLIRMLSEDDGRRLVLQRLNKTADLLAWDSLPTGSYTSVLEGFNTIYNEYAPYITDKGLMYIADHLTVQVLYPSAFTNQSLHLHFLSQEDSNGKYGRPKMLLKGREYYYHDGPLERRPNTETYALTLREIDGLLYDLKMNIYFSPLSGAEKDLIPFKYNGTNNAGHPSFSADGNRMYFSSDRPGGYGQLDIWYTDWANGEWTLPVNAGPEINSPGNELYPTITNERLFFSSDRRDEGYGGLDVYYVSLVLDIKRPYNLRAPINSAYDDFSVAFSDSKAGFFSSNRITGFGGDDIYSMYFQPATIPLDTLTFVLKDRSGTLQPLRVFDSSGNEMVGIHGENEDTEFSGLLTREVYSIETDSIFDTALTLVAYNKHGQKVQEFKSKSSSFQIEFLEQDEFDLMKKKNIDESELFDLSGILVSDQKEDFEMASVVLEDHVGQALDEVETDSLGQFLLKGLSWDRAYNLSAKGTSGTIEIDIIGETGARITALNRNPGKNSFAYTRARPEADWMMRTGLEVPAVFGIVPSAEISSNESPELRALGDSLIRTCEVDEDGFIEIGSLTTGRAYEISFKSSTFERGDKLVILDGSGDTTQTVRPDGNSSFVFEFMPPPSLLATAIVPMEIDRGRLEQKAKGNESITEPVLNETEEDLTRPIASVNLLGTSSELTSGAKIGLYNSAKVLLTETYAKEGGAFGLNQVPLDSIYFLRASVTSPMKLTSIHHGFEKSGVRQADGLWKFDFSEEEEEKVIALPNIYYRFDKYTLSASSTESLNNLFGYLMQNPKQKIKVLSHTDSRGPKDYNEYLSNLRAREVVRYLIRRGIDSNRLAYEGRGESQLVNECQDGTSCSNEKHAENRRTEFVLIKN